MTPPSPDLALQALANARRAILKGDLRQAWRWSEQAVRFAPDREEPWLFLAASTPNPRASLNYLKRALAINPESQHARKGVGWALKRLRQSQPGASPVSNLSQKQAGAGSSAVKPHPSKPTARPSPKRRRSKVNLLASRAMVRRQAVLLLWLVMVLCLVTGFTTWSGLPLLSQVLTETDLLLLAQLKPPTSPQQTILAPTESPNVQPTFTATALPTPLPSTTPTTFPSPTPFPTSTITWTPFPSLTPIQPVVIIPQVRPPEVAGNERWVAVNLSIQQAYAYEGELQIRNFLVSTGIAGYPTVIGTYRIYVKYRYANMSGPGYFLLDVPYVMYFFEGYGLHGTYWHSNFGTPMSHGCINLKTEDAAWLYDWTSIGTVINIYY